MIFTRFVYLLQHITANCFRTQFVSILLKQQILFSPDSVYLINFPNILTGQNFLEFSQPEIYMLKLYQIWNYLIPKVLVIIFRYYFTEFYDNPLKIMATGRYVTEPSQAKFTANLRKYCDIEKHNKN